MLCRVTHRKREWPEGGAELPGPEAVKTSQTADVTSAPEEPTAQVRVRRPLDLLFAVLSLAVEAIVIGSIRALPLGSTEVADDVSHWLEHIPRWLSSFASVTAGVGCFLFAVAILFVLVRSQWRDARNADTTWLRVSFTTRAGDGARPNKINASGADTSSNASTGPR